ncbi:MAG: glycosyltransferase [Desulfuromonadaceae bacterium]|nr:glycosyltransferase [Desulfuromonadaceae bacterium]
MNALVVAYYFPPFGGGGSERIHHFVKNMPELGIVPLVLTVDESCYEDIYHDPGLLNEYATSVSIFRSPMIFGRLLKQQKNQSYATTSIKSGNVSKKLRNFKKFVKSLIVPDEHVFWIPPALKVIRNILKNYAVGVIFSTAPPFSAHFLAALASTVYNIPLVLDYRDLWGENPQMAGKGLGRQVNKFLERYSLKKASQIIFTNHSAAEVMAARHPFISAKSVVIENGFDSKSILEMKHKCTDGNNQGVFRINYLGSLTRQRTPGTFLSAVKNFVELYPEYPVKVGFIGFAPAEHRQLVSDMGMDTIVQFYGSVSKEKALDIMCNHSDILLVLQRSGEGGATAIPGKLYEYLAAGIPVICLDEGLGVSSDFLRGLSLNTFVDYFDEEGILNVLTDITTNYAAAKDRISKLHDHLSPYERKNLSHRLAALLHGVSTDKKS